MGKKNEKIDRKKSIWQDLVCLILVFYFAFFPNFIFQPQMVFALTENAGTDFTLCTAGTDMVRDGGSIDVTFLWVFSSQQNDYFDNDGLPLTPDGGHSVDTPVMAASTQVSYWLEVDDDMNFGSPAIQTGEVASSAQFYFYGGTLLTEDRTWFWRIMVKDSYGSQTDWVDGGSFSFGTKTILKGKIKLKGDMRFKFP
ncbi:MAG: hypothetical protein Q7T50_02765 [Candidatus Magasanikbacteria bacterium]|nr:hypothetical protein [Candidatus Magasanikbacteria bacterium]